MPFVVSPVPAARSCWPCWPSCGPSIPSIKQSGLSGSWDATSSIAGEHWGCPALASWGHVQTMDWGLNPHLLFTEPCPGAIPLCPCAPKVPGWGLARQTLEVCGTLSSVPGHSASQHIQPQALGSAALSSTCPSFLTQAKLYWSNSSHPSR